MFYWGLVLALCLGVPLKGFELAIVSMFRDEAPCLREWVEYHKLAGVDHFWLYNDRSADDWERVLKPYLEEGIVEVTDWPTPEGCFHVPNQLAAFQDGLKHAKGNAKWVALIDIDEFLVPLKDKNLPRCLENHFSHAVAVYINWRNFGTGGVRLLPYEPILFKLTACSLSSHPANGIGKSIVRPECVRIEETWYPHHFVLEAGLNYVNGEGQPMAANGVDLFPDGKHYEKFLRLNHYCLRDENFYQNQRLAKALRGEGERTVRQLEEHYVDFSLVQDKAILEFIQQAATPQSLSFWRN